MRRLFGDSVVGVAVRQCVLCHVLGVGRGAGPTPQGVRCSARNCIPGSRDVFERSPSECIGGRLVNRAILFGGSGFIGRHLYAALKSAGSDVLIADMRAPNYQHGASDYVFVDVRKPIPIAFAADSGVVYNLAAIHRTPGHAPHEYYETNVLGALNVTGFARRIRARRLVFTSSISVYGASEEEKTEASPPAPNSDYGRSKLIAEEIHRAWRSEEVGSKLVIVRPAVGVRTA